MMTSTPPFLIVGAGFSGAVMARELAERLNRKVIVIDERPHLAGNCHTERDEKTGVMVHRYGPHIFNTDSKKVWDYVNRFTPFHPFYNRVKAINSRGVFSLPINLLTINQFFGKQMNPKEAQAFLEEIGDKSIETPANFEEQALKFVGKELYEAFFKGYTEKQWGCDPRELSASILKRLPIRFNYDDSYYNTCYQGIPIHGYTAIVEGILDHPLIEVRLSTRYESTMRETAAHLFFTGALDAFFAFSEGRLGYRTVTFERIDAEGDYQGNAVINYTDKTVPYTRVHEHKHFAPWEQHAKTVAFREWSHETTAADIPYYPKRLQRDLELLEKYRSLAKSERGVSFLGRLATYRYLDMDVVIQEALDFADEFCRWSQTGLDVPAPLFAGEPAVL